MFELSTKLSLNQQQKPALLQHLSQRLAILILVLVLHSALIGIALLGIKQPSPQPITPPTIQGVMILAQTSSQAIQPTQPMVKQTLFTQPKSVSSVPPVKNAPPSDNAITQPDVTPVIEKTAATEETVPEVAPQAPSAQAIKEPEEVIPPRSDAAHLNNPAPNYPSMSRRLGEQGRVLLDVYILANGRVGELQIKQSSGFKRLDDAALQAVKKWQYVPARRGSEAIPFWYIQPLSFSLNS